MPGIIILNIVFSLEETLLESEVAWGGVNSVKQQSFTKSTPNLGVAFSLQVTEARTTPAQL